MRAWLHAWTSLTAPPVTAEGFPQRKTLMRLAPFFKDFFLPFLHIQYDWTTDHQSFIFLCDWTAHYQPPFLHISMWLNRSPPFLHISVWLDHWPTTTLPSHFNVTKPLSTLPSYFNVTKPLSTLPSYFNVTGPLTTNQPSFKTMFAWLLGWSEVGLQLNFVGFNISRNWFQSIGWRCSCLASIRFAIHS